MNAPNWSSEAARIADLPRSDWKKATRKFGTVKDALSDWSLWAEARQLPPPGDWRTWLLMAGRGFGKTRAGAEWVRSLAEAGPVFIALVGATMDEARAVMVEGQSGILSICPDGARPHWQPSLGRLRWDTGAEARIFSAENPEKLRGPEHHFAWCDELGKWAYAQASWDNLQMGLRAGDRPRALVTTTPRPVPLLRTLLADPGTAVARGRTVENRMLADSALAWFTDRYGGTRLGRQELDGELIEDAEGALWTRAMIEDCRVRDVPPLRRVVIGVDPPAGVGGDACGIVVVALAEDSHAYVLADASVEGRSPEGWARAVASAALRWNADRVIAEANQGGAMVGSVLQAAGVVLPLTLVHATRGKSGRAEPVAALYEGGRAHHVAAFPELEDELCGLLAGGGYEGPGRSPDRADALVWAMTELMLGKRGVEPRVRVL